MTINVTNIYNTIMKIYGLVPYHLFNGYSLPPLQYLLYVTRRCNLRCSFCFFVRDNTEHDNAKLEAKEMTSAELLSLIKQLPRFGVLTLTGGEPFIRSDIMDILTASARYRTTHLISNGTLIKPDEIRTLIAHGSNFLFGKGLVLVGISVQGTSETHNKVTQCNDAYAKTIATIQTLVEEKKRQKKSYPLINFKTVISPDSLDELPILYKQASAIGTDIYNVLAEYTLPVSKDQDDHQLQEFDSCLYKPSQVNTTHLEEVIKELVSIQKTSKTQLRISPSQVPIHYLLQHYQQSVNLDAYYCHSPWSKVEISPYGDVYPCLEFYAGNVKTTPFLKIWNGEKFRTFRKQLKKKGLFPACVGCCNMELKK